MFHDVVSLLFVIFKKRVKKMATLGNALMGALLGHSDAEKMFR
jgi:hypothetical protein